MRREQHSHSLTRIHLHCILNICNLLTLRAQRRVLWPSHQMAHKFIKNSIFHFNIFAYMTYSISISVNILHLANALCVCGASCELRECLKKIRCSQTPFQSSHIKWQPFSCVCVCAFGFQFSREIVGATHIICRPFHTNRSPAPFTE